MLQTHVAWNKKWYQQKEQLSKLFGLADYLHKEEIREGLGLNLLFD